MGVEASCGASSCQPALLSSAVALVCARTDRTVMKTFMTLPIGGLQLGGSLIETSTVPMFGPCIEELPLQLMIATATTTIAKIDKK